MEDDVAWLTPPADVRAAIVHAARLAPSGGNSQPWQMEWKGSQLLMRIDRARTSRLDLGYRASYVSLGAALFNAEAAAAARGLAGTVSIGSASGLSGPGSEPVGMLELGRGIDREMADAYPHVLLRQTNRRPGDRGDFPQAIAELLSVAAVRSDCKVHLVVDRETLTTAAEIIADSDRLRYLDEHLHREMFSELVEPGVDSLEVGIDVRTLELDETDVAKLAVARRPDVMAHLDAWQAGRALGDDTRARILSSSALAFVTTKGSTPADYVRGGKGVEAFWVAAQSLGLGVQPVAAMLVYARSAEDFVTLAPKYAAELADHSKRLRELSELEPDETTLLILRLSWAPAPSVRSRRLPMESMAKIHD